MIPVKCQDVLISHSAEFIGHGASVYGQEIRQLLTVERNIEGGAAGLQGLLRQIGKQLSPAIFFLNMGAALWQHGHTEDPLPMWNTQSPSDSPLPMRRGGGAWRTEKPGCSGTITETAWNMR